MLVDIKDFGAQIQKLISGQDLGEEMAYAMFCDVLNNRQPDLQQGAFLAALVAKGETADELFAAWRAIDEIDTTHVTPRVSGPLCENSGTGMDGMNTINVSTAAALVAAAGGVVMARHGARALSSRCGTVDLVEALGIDVECSAQTVSASIEQAGIGVFNGMSPLIHPAALGRILSQIRFGSTLNIAASLAHPARPSLAVRGVYHPEMIEKVAQLMRRIGFTRAMVVCGQDSASGRHMDELSPCGSSVVTMLSPDSTSSFTLEPEDAGIARSSLAEITWNGPLADEQARFLSVLAGRGEKALADFVCLNAAAIFVVSGSAATLRDGVMQSREILASGAAIERLALWRKVQGSGV
jgi:anthranilate phosphoribosyltransferase